MLFNKKFTHLYGGAITKSKGMVLISMISILGIITICLASLSVKTQQEIKDTNIYLNRMQAKQNAFAAERYVLQKIALHEKKKIRKY